MTVIQAPVQGGKRRHLLRDLCLLGLFACALAVPASSWVSSLFFKGQSATSFEFRYDRELTKAVRLDGIRVQPRGEGLAQIFLCYTQLLSDKALGTTTLCFHVVPEDRANVEERDRSRGYNHYDFTPDPPLGSWHSTYCQERLLSFPSPDNQRATIRVGTWSSVTKQATPLYSYPFDFAEFERGRDGIYADHVATPHRRNLVIYLVTALSLLATIMLFSRWKKVG